MVSVFISACGGGGSGGDGGGAPPPPGGTRFTLGVSVAGGGSVSSQPGGITCGAICSASYDAGTTVTLTASPATGQNFSGWGGECAGAALTCSVTMSQARTASATFAPISGGSGWTPSTPLSDINGGASSSRVAIDADGRAIAVWHQITPNTSDIWASRYLPGSGWSAPVRLDTSDSEARLPQIALDRSTGRAMVAWQQLTSASGYDLWARPFDPATGWGTATVIDSQTATVGLHTLGMDASGNTVVVWSQLAPNTRFSIWSNRHLAASGWGTAVLVEDSEVTGQQDGDPEVAVLPGGDAIAVWRRSTGTATHLWANRLPAGGSWGTPSELVRDAGVDQFIGAIDLAADANGNAMLVWSQGDFAGSARDTTLWFKRFGSGGWGASARVAPPVQTTQGFLSTPVVMMNAAGTALAGWVREDRSVMAALAPAGGSFGTAVAIRPAGSLEITALPQLGLDDQGNGAAAYAVRATNQTPDIWIARLTATSGWATAVLHDTANGTAGDPALAMNERGHIATTWTQFADGQGTRILGRYFTSGR